MIFWVTIALWMSSSVAQECPYAKFNPRHTACLPPNTACRIFANGSTPTDMAKIISLHNQFRSRVATGKLKGFPQASNMMQMEWNPEIAMIAQKYTDQCKGSTECDNCRNTADYDYVGQNFYWMVDYSVPKEPRWSEIIQKWFDGYKSFNVKAIADFESYPGTNDADGFSQVVWATTSQVGCGYTAFKNTGPEYPNIPVREYYACNYAPAGNGWNENTVYISGKPCSNCEKGYSCSTEYEGLCKRN